MASNGISFREALRMPGLLKEVRACFDQTQDGVSSGFGRGPANCDAVARTVGPQGAGPYRMGAHSAWSNADPVVARG